eukprot:3508290-Pyramimonas_sp.AAC.1
MDKINVYAPVLEVEVEVVGPTVVACWLPHQRPVTHKVRPNGNSRLVLPIRTARTALLFIPVFIIGGRNQSRCAYVCNTFRNLHIHYDNRSVIRQMAKVLQDAKGTRYTVHGDHS